MFEMTNFYEYFSRMGDLESVSIEIVGEKVEFSLKIIAKIFA